MDLLAGTNWLIAMAMYRLITSKEHDARGELGTADPNKAHIKLPCDISSPAFASAGDFIFGRFDKLIKVWYTIREGR